MIMIMITIKIVIIRVDEFFIFICPIFFYYLFIPFLHVNLLKMNKPKPYLDLYDIKKFNGLANSFYGWGGEDDDLYHR